MMGSLWLVVFAGAVTTLMSSLLITSTSHWHGFMTWDSSAGVQKFHATPTPRVGGVGIFMGATVAWFFCSGQSGVLLGKLLLAGVPAFTFGFLEDVTKRVSVTVRLIATMASGWLAWILTGYSLTRLDIQYIDTCLNYLPISVLLTSFAVGGVANSVNIVDGFNGLASLCVFWGLIGLALIAHNVVDPSLTEVSLALAFSVLGFFFLNWPFGKIFMGDGGSYFIGFALAWLCVLLTQRHADVSAFVALLICVHPITEVLFSILRRTIKKTHPGQPDRLHLHSLLKARYVRRWFKGRSMTYQNSATGLLVGGFSLIPVTIAQFVYNSTRWSVVAVFVFVCIYIALYARMVRFRWTSPVSFLFKRRR